METTFCRGCKLPCGGEVHPNGLCFFCFLKFAAWELEFVGPTAASSIGSEQEKAMTNKWLERGAPDVRG